MVISHRGRLALVAGIMSGVAVLAGCGGNHASHAQAAQSAKARASAAATSQNTKQDEKTAQALASKCLPSNEAVMLTSAGRHAFEQCESIPKGPERTAAENCFIKGVQKLPIPHGTAARAAYRHQLVLVAAGCDPKAAAK